MIPARCQFCHISPRVDDRLPLVTKMSANPNVIDFDEGWTENIKEKVRLWAPRVGSPSRTRSGRVSAVVPGDKSLIFASYVI